MNGDENQTKPPIGVQQPSISSTAQPTPGGIKGERAISSSLGLDPELDKIIKITPVPELDKPAEGFVGVSPITQTGRKETDVPPPAAVQPPPAQEEEKIAPVVEDQKILSIDEARELVRRKKQLIPIGEKNPDSAVLEAGIVVREEEKAA